MDPNSPDIGYGAPYAKLRRGAHKLINEPLAAAITGTGAAVRATLRAGLRHPVTRLPSILAGKVVVAVATALILSTDDPSLDTSNNR